MAIDVIAGTGTRGNPIDGAPAATDLAPISAMCLAGDRLVFTQYESIFELTGATLRQLFAGAVFATGIAAHERELLVVEPEARRMRSIEPGRKPTTIASARTAIKTAWKAPCSFAELDNLVFVADEEGDAIWKIDRAARSSERFVDVPQPHCIVARGDELIVATNGDGIMRVDVAARSVTPWIPMGGDREQEVATPKAMIAAPDGALWISDYETVRRYDDATKRFEIRLGTGRYPTSFDAACTDPRALAIPTPDCIAVDAQGVLYTALFGRILRVAGQS